jgi:hypothetical protein
MDARQMHDWCMVTLDYLAEVSPWADDFRQAVSAASTKGNVEGLRMCVSDLREWVSYAPPADRQRVHERLLAKVGHGLYEVDLARNKRLASILKRGRIATDNEFRLLMARVDEIYEDEGKQAEVNRINELLSEYEDRKQQKQADRS